MIKRKITEIKKRDPLTEQIIACAYKVHSELCPGFSENIYHNSLRIALKQQGLRYQTQESFTVLYQGKDVGRFKLDLIIEDKVVVEVKALTGNIPTVFELQLLSYLKPDFDTSLSCCCNLLLSLGLQKLDFVTTSAFEKFKFLFFNELRFLSVKAGLKASRYKIGLLINFGNKSCQVRRLMI